MTSISVFANWTRNMNKLFCAEKWLHENGIFLLISSASRGHAELLRLTLMTKTKFRCSFLLRDLRSWWNWAGSLRNSSRVWVRTTLQSGQVPLVPRTQRAVTPKVVPKPLSPRDDESTVVFPVGYSSPGALNALCLTSSWYIAFVKVTLNILMVIILSRAWISKCAMFIFWHYIL